MRKLPVAFAILSLSVALMAQEDAEIRKTRVRPLVLLNASQISEAEQQQIAKEIEKMSAFITSVDEISEHLQYALQERGYFKDWSAIPTRPSLAAALPKKPSMPHIMSTWASSTG